MTKETTGFMKPMNVSAELENVIGKGPMPRTEVTKKIWEYIKKNDLQDANDKRTINPDDRLAPILGDEPISMFKMTAKVSKHLT